MDALDVRIIRAMGIRPYEKRPKDPNALKPSRIAERVEVTPATVKARLKGMEEAGVIRGYKTIPNLRLLGLSGEAWFFRFPEDEAKDARIPTLTSLDGLLELHDFLGRGLCVDFASRDAADRDAKIAEIAKALGDDKPRKFYNRDLPPVRRDLTPLDWRILRSLRWDAKKSLDAVADVLGVTGRTVRRRYDLMAAEGSFFAIPLVDPSKAQGLFVFNLHFFLAPDALQAATRRVLEAYGDRHLYAYAPGDPELGSLDLVAVAHSTSEVDQMRREGGEIEGVLQAESWFFRGLHDFSSWIDSAVDQRAEHAVSR